MFSDQSIYWNELSTVQLQAVQDCSLTIETSLNIFGHRTCFLIVTTLCVERSTIMAVFVLLTYNASERLRARHFSASFCSSFNSSRIKTGERRIIRLDVLNRLVRLHRQTKSFSY